MNRLSSPHWPRTSIGPSRTSSGPARIACSRSPFGSWATEAEDVAQDAFIRAYRALCAWGPDRIRALRLDAWLATIAVNVSRTRYGRRRATAGRESLTFLDELDHPRATPTDAPDTRLARTEASSAWAVRLLALPARYREPIVLRHVDGLAYDEIALALERPEGTVKAQVHRGLALLRAVVAAELRTANERDEAGGDASTTSSTIHRPTKTTDPEPRLQEVPR